MILPIEARVSAGGTRAAAWGAVAAIAVACLLLSCVFWASVLRWSAEDANALLRDRLAPLEASAMAEDRANKALNDALGGSSASESIERLASALPADAALVTIGRESGAPIVLEIETPDPDRLRAALRANRALPILRDAGQVRTDGGIRVILRGDER